MKIFFRTDANSTIGLGHLSRCASLALEFKKKCYKVDFVIRDNKIAEEYLDHFNLNYIPINMKLQDEKEFLYNLINREGYQIGIFDSYELNSKREYLSLFKGIKDLTVVTIEGFKKYPVQGNIIINPNIFAPDKKNLYNQKDSKLLFGINYSLLKPSYINTDIKNKFGKRVLITFGGTDTCNATIQVLKTLLDINHKISVVIGPFFDKKSQRKIKLIGEAYDNIILHENVKDLKKIFQKSFLAICAAGATISELIYFNIPALVYWTTNNQKLIAKKYGELNLGFNLGDFRNFDDRVLREKFNFLIKNKSLYNYFIKNNKSKIFGNPVRRVVEEIIKYIT